MITMHFEAETLEELRNKVAKAFFGNMPPLQEPLQDYNKYQQAKAVEEPVQGSPDLGKPQDTGKARSHKKAAAKAPVAEPEASEEAVEEVDGAEQMKSVTAAVNTVNGNGTAATDTVAAMKVKDAVIPILQEAFAAGKAPKLRILLETYGDGAKSFPEIAPENFLGIQKAIKDGALKD